MTPSRSVSCDRRDAELERRGLAGARPRAIAAATRTGVKIECIVFDPPVIWFQTSSGRASASVTCTLSSGRSISSAIVIATAVVIPWPDLGARQGERDGAVGVDRDRDQVRRRPGRVGQQVGQVVEVDRLSGGDGGLRCLHRVSSRRGDERRRGDQVADEPPPRDAVGDVRRRAAACAISHSRSSRDVCNPPWTQTPGYAASRVAGRIIPPRATD